MVDRVEEKPEVEHQTTEREAPQEKAGSVRESIRAAIKEQEAKETEVEVKEPKEPKEIKVKAHKRVVSKKEEKDETIDAKEPKENEDTAEAVVEAVAKEVPEEVAETEVPEVKEEPKEKVHTALPKEFKEKWASIPSEVRSAANKLAKQVSDQNAELGRIRPFAKDMEAAIQPYMPAIQNFNLPPATVVSRLFQWMEALAGPQKEAALRQLGAQFGIKLDVTPDSYDPNYQPDIVQQVQPVIEQFSGKFSQEINDLKSQIQRQNDSAANNAVNSWAGLQADGSYTNKPYYPQVRLLMATLIKDGAVPLINGRIDLDGAYDMACNALPEVRQLLMEEHAQRTAKEALDKKAKEDAAKRAKLAQARSTNVSLKPSAPSGTPQLNGKSKSGAPVSARESIKAAIQELRN